MVAAYLRRAYSVFTARIFDVPPRLSVFLFFLLILLFPLTEPKPYILFVLVLANIYALFAASWDILAGRTGQISLGHALFFGVGAYTTAMLCKYYALPLWVAIPVGMGISVLTAVLVGFPCLRVKGPYLSLVTMAFPLILTSIFMMFKSVTGGELGIFGLPTVISHPPYTLYQVRLAEFYVSLLLLAVSAVVLYRIANSKIGVIFVSILDDEVASKMSGVNTTKYKIMAFAISAFFASLAGGFYAPFMRVVGPSTLALTMSFLPVIMTILGGIGTIYGPIVGAYVLTIIDRYVLEIVVPIKPEWHMIIYTVIVIIFVLKWPRGAARSVVDKLKDLEEARELEEIEKKKEK